MEKYFKATLYSASISIIGDIIFHLGCNYFPEPSKSSVALTGLIMGVGGILLACVFAIMNSLCEEKDLNGSTC